MHGSVASVEMLLADLGDQAGDFAMQCSETGGIVGRLNRQIAAEAANLTDLTAAMGSLSESQATTQEAAGELLATAHHAAGIVSQGNKVAQLSLGEVSRLLSSVTGVEGSLQAFLQTLTVIGGVSRTLKDIAEHAEMLSLNARIEAARGGESTKPFQLLADEMRQLARTTAESSDEVSSIIGQLDSTAQPLIASLSDNIATGRDATAHIDTLGRSLAEMAALVEQVRDRSRTVGECNARAMGDAEKLAGGIASFGEVARASVENAGEVHAQLGTLESDANRILNTVAHAGVDTRDSPFIALARKGAEEIATLIERELGRGLAPEHLFDIDYRPRPDTDPVQYDNRFADFADRHIRPLLDRRTHENPAVVGCVMVDVNGYLPTHITERSQPPIPGERRRNLEVSRNRQIFMDPQTRRALDGDMEFYVFAYRQDFGEGRYRALRSVLVPLAFNGRRWGLYEVGYVL